jgi:protein SCO1/2
MTVGVRRPWLVLALLLAKACRSQGADGGTWLQPPAPAPAVSGTSARHGGATSLEGLRGRVVMLSFGYSHCVDICPVTLRTMQGVLARLGQDARDVAPVYVSIDPARDTGQRLRDFVQPFDDRIDAWMVTDGQLATALEGYGVSAAHRPVNLRGYVGKEAPARGDYSMDHSGGIWVIDRHGRLRTRYVHGAEEEAIASGVRRLLTEELARAGA